MTKPMKLAEAISLLDDAVARAEQIHESTEFDSLEIAEIAKRYWAVKELHDAAKKIITRLYHVSNSYDKGIFPAQLEKRDLDMVRVPELGRSFSIRTNTSASMLDKPKAFEWLRDNGHEDMIQETVNAGTLASFARSLQLDEGIDLPDDIFKVTTFNTVGSAKYTPKEGKG